MSKTAGSTFFEDAVYLHSAGLISDQGMAKIASVRNAILGRYIDMLEGGIDKEAKLGDVDRTFHMPGLTKHVPGGNIPEAERAKWLKRQAVRRRASILGLADQMDVGYDDLINEHGNVPPSKVRTVLTRIKNARIQPVEGVVDPQARVKFRGRKPRLGWIQRALSSITGESVDDIAVRPPQEQVRRLDDLMPPPMLKGRAPAGVTARDWLTAKKRFFKARMGAVGQKIGWKGAIGATLLAGAGAYKFGIKPALEAKRHRDTFVEMKKVVPELQQEDKKQVENAYSVLQSFAPTIAKSPVAAGQIVKQLVNLGNVADVETINNLSEIEERLSKAQADPVAAEGKGLLAGALLSAIGAPAAIAGIGAGAIQGKGAEE